MEALVCKKLGDPTVPLNSSEDSPFTIEKSYPIPELKTPTSVRVRVKATSLNFANYLQVLGNYQEKPKLPFIPGSDYSGVVDSVGSKVTKFKVGDPVCSFASVGYFAQFILADESLLWRVPDGCDLVAAGALPVAYGTSHVALVHRAQLGPNHVLLVLGAAGGVGLAAVQIGKACGATVIAVARGKEKVQFLKSLGTDYVVDLTKGNVTDSVKGFLKARKLKGVDVLYDPVGGKLTKEAMKLLNWGAHILVIGFASGEVPVIPANIALVKNWTVHGFYMRNYRILRPAVLEDSLQELMSWLSSGLISINVSHSFSLSEIDASGNANPVWRTKFSALIDSLDTNFSHLALNVEVYSRDPLFLRERLFGTATVILKFLEKYLKDSEVAKKKCNKPRALLIFPYEFLKTGKSLFHTQGTRKASSSWISAMALT